MADLVPLTGLATNAAGDQLLLRLFARHFDDPIPALMRLDRHLARLRLPFNLRNQLRELEHPPQPGLPDGIPSLIYYYVPNSGWGSNNPFPSNPLNCSFVYSSDGIGLNLGCPVRLLRALDALARLPSADHHELEEGLASATKHLATVEELLWATGWKSPSELRRGGPLPGATGHVDWALKADGCPLYVEAKFRPSDWPRNTDQGTFVPIGGSFLAKAAHKFPKSPRDAALHLVAITALENITEDVVHLIGAELESHPQIHAVTFRTFAQTTHVLSLYDGIRDRTLGLLAPPSVREYPTNYAILFNIEQREKRLAGRASSGAGPSIKPSSRVACSGIQPRMDAPVIIPEPGAYRLKLLSRGPDGEPAFESVPKWLWVEPNKDGKATSS
jgi:hypothetical protein